MIILLLALILSCITNPVWRYPLQRCAVGICHWYWLVAGCKEGATTKTS